MHPPREAEVDRLSAALERAQPLIGRLGGTGMS
jgi:hypothetical protein